MSRTVCTYGTKGLAGIGNTIPCGCVVDTFVAGDIRGDFKFPYVEIYLPPPCISDHPASLGENTL